MHKVVEELCVSLEKLGDATESAWTDDRGIGDVYGWNQVNLTRQDFAEVPRSLAKRLREVAPNEVNAELEKKIAEACRKLSWLQANTVPQIFQGAAQALQGAPAFLGTMVGIQTLVDPFFHWESTDGSKATPPQLARKLKALRIEIENISIDKVAIQQDIKSIKDGALAADALPIDLKSLEDARNKVAALQSAADKAVEEIIRKREVAKDQLDIIVEHAKESDRLVAKCDEAYKITTTIGLAASFDQRRSRTASSMWVWVIGLLVALWLGASQGAHRLELLAKVVTTPGVGGAAFAAQLVTALISIGAPMWFAWIATKQIGQRFRLSEDYAFKAAVAKAYEGYRKEAVRIDPEFEKRLFASALTRLEEAPLRLVETETHGSPWHELLNSPALKAALKSGPEFRERFLDLINQVMKNELSPEKVAGEGKAAPNPIAALD